MPIQPEVNGEFYIDNVRSNFFLRENDAWDKKGKLVRAEIVGLVSESANPFVAAQTFELAPSVRAIHYYDAFSQPRSSVRCDGVAVSSCDIIFTNNLAGFLSTGTDVICRAAMSPTDQQAVLTFTDTIVPAFSPLWVVMPLVPDVAMAGLRAIFGGEPV